MADKKWSHVQVELALSAVNLALVAPLWEEVSQSPVWHVMVPKHLGMLAMAERMLAVPAFAH